MQSFKIESPDHIQVQAYAWLTENPVAILQIAHGMMEHARRYDHFARWMNEKGVGVYASDHIGHGLTAGNEEELCHFPRKDDWQRSVKILHRLTERIKADHPGLPVFLLGHSMGSVMVQSYMIDYGDEAQGYILSGVIRQPGWMASLGVLLSRLLASLSGPGSRSKLMIALGYGSYNRKFSPDRNGWDWLCSNSSAVDEYVASPLCGIPCTNRFYENLSTGFRHISRKGNLEQIPAGIPVCIIAGEQDAAGGFGSVPEKINDLLTRHARANVRLKIYPEGRHEMLNEKNREEVYGDVLRWIFEIRNSKLEI